MEKSYLAAFLLPSPASRRLTVDGWEFDSPNRVPEDALQVLQRVFQGTERAGYLGMQVVEGKGLKATAVRDPAGRIENIFVQLKGRRPEEIRTALNAAGLGDVEVFVPAK
jgi:hypothetical protein